MTLPKYLHYYSTILNVKAKEMYDDNDLYLVDHEQSSGASKAMLLFLHKQNVDIILSEIHKDSEFCETNEISQIFQLVHLTKKLVLLLVTTYINSGINKKSLQNLG